MTDRIQVVITGNASQVSQAFGQVARDAEKMGASVEQSGQKASRSFEDVKKQATAVGAALGTVVGGMSIAGQSFVAQEQQLRGLQRAYGESADDIERFADKLQQTTVYSDDAARQSAQIASTLQRSYGLTTEQITQLISRTADLASVNVTSTGAQFSLADAVQRTSSAIRGEGESAEALGLTLSDSAVAAEAAARGLSGWNTTMSESEKAAFRFTLLMEQSTYAMGAAEEAADTSAGQMRQLMNSFQDVTQSAGEALGPLGEYTAVLGDLALAAPLAGAALGRMFAGLGALGITAPIAGAALLAGGSALYASQLNQPGSSAERQTAGALGGIAGFIPSVIPGSFGDALFADIQSQFLGVINSRDFEDAATVALISPLEDADLAVVYNRVANLLGVAPGTMSNAELEQMAGLRAQAGGYASTGQYLLATAAQNPNFTQTPSGSYVPLHVYQEQLRQNAMLLNNQIATQATSYVGAPGTSGLAGATGTYMQPPATYYGTQPAGYTGPYQPQQVSTVPGGAEFDRSAPSAIDARMGPVVNAGDLAIFNEQLGSLDRYRDALREGRVELELLNGAQMNAADAQLTFKVTQDVLIEDQQQYTGQLGEYSTQLGYVNEAQEILNQRKADGIAISAEEQDFLDGAASAQERLNGGREDAIIALGIQAEQYAENMKAGDALNQSMDGVGDSVDGLTESVNTLIETLGGVPPETEANVTTDAPEATEEINGTASAAAALDGTNATVSVDANTGAFWSAVGGLTGRILGTSYIQIEAAPGATIGGGNRHGGILGYANGGVVARLADAGPELLYFRDGGMGVAARDGLYNVPRGTYVTPAPASKRAIGQSGGITIENMTVVANNPREFAQQLYEFEMGGVRS